MNPKFISTLINLGLTENEAKLYLTLLLIGPNPASIVARKSRITRTTAYAALDNLLAKGLVSMIENRGIKQYTAVKAEKIKDFAEQEQEKAHNNYEDMKNILPYLKALSSDLVLTPKVKYFEGLEGIKNIYNDSIEALKDYPKSKRVKYVYSSAPEVSYELRKFLDKYIKERKKHDISIRGIFPDNQRSLSYSKNARKHKADVRIMPRDISLEFESEVNIYGDKIAIMSLNKDSLHGVIIESPEIASTQRVLFEIIWRASKQGEVL